MGDHQQGSICFSQSNPMAGPGWIIPTPKAWITSVKKIVVAVLDVYTMSIYSEKHYYLSNQYEGVKQKMSKGQNGFEMTLLFTVKGMEIEEGRFHPILFYWVQFR